MNKKDISYSIEQLEYELCSGCGACECICPEQAITMYKDEFGFFRPKVDDNLCVNCGLCAKRCTVLNPLYKNVEKPACFAVMADDAIRRISSSGGMFTIAAEYVIKHEGYVCGAAYKDNFEVEHILINKYSDLSRLRGSKYMQSEASPIYPKIKELLEDGKIVLFTGMPCQVSGLYAYLGKDFKNLYTIDIFCHGITSTKIFNKYHNDVLGGKKLIRLEFKAKEPWGWHAGVKAWFADGTKYFKPLESDPYFIAYLQNISKNLACGTCKVNRLPRQGDLSMGDFWKIEHFDCKLNDGRGTSAVLINNPKGEAFFSELRNYMTVCQGVPLEIAIKGNRCITNPYKLHKNRLHFFNNFSTISFASLVSGCFRNRVYEQSYLELIKQIPKNDHELYYIARFAAKHARGRRIVTWILSDRFERILKKYFGLTVAFGVSQRKEALVDGRIKDFNLLRGKQEQYYLVSLHRAYDDSVYKQLIQFGYRPEEDFVFRKFKPIIIENLDLSKSNYYDTYGNSIEGFRSFIGKVIFRGFNNHIMIANNMESARFLTFDLCANSRIDIGERVHFDAPVRIESKGFDFSSSLKIGNGCVFSQGGLFRFYTPAEAIIGENCTASSKFELHVNQGKKAIIGRDCMFSFENELWAGDGHSIFDVKSGICSNQDMSERYHHSNNLVIGNHVWLGKQAFIMHGTNIGSGSIVGARSVVKGVFHNNCSIVGNPAKKIKEDVAWSRDGMATNVNSCGLPEYAVLTSHASAPISGRKVLVIGGTRFMGIQLVKELIALGNDVTIATRGIQKDNFGFYINRINVDISNEKSVKSALNGKYFDIIFDNLAYCPVYVNNILSNLNCNKYIQLSSVETYKNMTLDMKESYFNPYLIPLEMCDINSGYVKGKIQSEVILYKKYKQFNPVTVRIPYVTKTDRLFYYCKNIVNKIPMKIDDVSRGFTFIRDTEVGKFLPWIAAQNFTGPINLASEGIVTIKMILDYIEKKTNKKALIDVINGEESPFHVYNEKTFSMNMDKVRQLGYKTSNINDWFWNLMDQYINRALNLK